MTGRPPIKPLPAIDRLNELIDCDSETGAMRWRSTGTAMITIELAGVPRGKGRPRFVKATGIAFTPARTRSYESDLKLAAQDVMDGRPPLDCPLRVVVTAMMPVPRSWSRVKQRLALLGALLPTGRPDWENIAKCLDALNQVVWRDDALIVDGRIVKQYSERPALRIEVTPLIPTSALQAEPRRAAA